MACPSTHFRSKFLFLCLFFIGAIQGKTCVQDGFESHLATKTPYRFVGNTNASIVSYPGCEPIKLWGLVRHGTRNPTLKLIEKMKERLPEVRDSILKKMKTASGTVHHSDLDAFRKWNSKLDDKDDKKLTHEGEDEMLLLAERLQMRFPAILDAVYSNSSYNFKYTATQRTKRSAHYFAAGLFGKKTVRDVVYPEALKRDPILRFYKLCSKWRREVSKNPNALHQRLKFESGPVVAKLVEEINRKLGTKLDLGDIQTMYQVCGFETAWNKRSRSPWCSPFTTENFKVMEYLEDLKYYWVDGYGHELTYKQACPAFTNMVEFFQNKKRYPKTTVYFTHSGTLLKMLGHLGLFRDDKHLLADDYSKNADRKWRVSQIDAFGTNLVFVLFNCSGKRQILTLHQEEITRLPSCPDSDLCDFDIVLKHYKDSLENCNFDEMCDNEIIPDDDFEL